MNHAISPFVVWLFHTDLEFKIFNYLDSLLTVDGRKRRTLEANLLLFPSLLSPHYEIRKGNSNLKIMCISTFSMVEKIYHYFFSVKNFISPHEILRSTLLQFEGHWSTPVI